MLPLQGRELGEKSVEVGVGDLGASLHVVETLVPQDLGTKLPDAPRDGARRPELRASGLRRTRSRRRFGHRLHATVSPMPRAKGRSSLLALLRNALTFLVALAAIASSNSSTAAPLTSPVASYQISCRLDAEKKVVEGTELLTWTNTTSKPAATLQFHLYLNAFRNKLSTFWREAGGEHRGNRLPESWGSIEVTRMTLADGSDLLPAMTYISPDDGNPHDRTVAEVQLPRAVAPGETISLSIDFRSRLPRVSTRTGWKGDFFLVAQWFPKIGVLEEDGWNCHQFHSASEFFADFGDYDVSIEVPARYRGKVGATGRRVEERDVQGDRVLYRFKQESVHDFAWTADPGYLVGLDHYREPGVADVQITLLLQPEHEHLAARYFKATRTAISGYGRVLGPYPYPTLTVVDPPWGARGAGRNGVPHADHRRELPDRARERAAARRASPSTSSGHQYFYGMLASNEFEEPWLDEGFNQYMEARVVGAAYGPDQPVPDPSSAGGCRSASRSTTLSTRTGGTSPSRLQDALASNCVEVPQPHELRRARLLQDGARRWRPSSGSSGRPR